MARFIVDDVLYDTDLSTKVVEYSVRQQLPGSMYCITKDATLYTTDSGRWFSVYKEDFDKFSIRVNTVDDAKRILRRLAAIPQWEKYFGKLVRA